VPKPIACVGKYRHPPVQLPRGVHAVEEESMDRGNWCDPSHCARNKVVPKRAPPAGGMTNLGNVILAHKFNSKNRSHFQR